MSRLNGRTKKSSVTVVAKGDVVEVLELKVGYYVTRFALAENTKLHHVLAYSDAVTGSLDGAKTTAT